MTPTTMNTQADYDFMKAVLVEMNKQTKPLSHTSHKKKAFSQVRARLFTINLNLRPELPLPQELTDKIYHEALMSELIEKLPAFKKFRWDSHRGKDYYEERVFDDYWIDLLQELRVYGRKIWKPIRYHQRECVNKKEYLIEVLTGNGVKCNKKWTLNRLIKAL